MSNPPIFPDDKDERPLKDGWAPGNYYNTCFKCSMEFIGDKRACQCAPCAYNDKEPVDLQWVLFGMTWILLFTCILYILISK